MTFEPFPIAGREPSTVNLGDWQRVEQLAEDEAGRGASALRENTDLSGRTFCGFPLFQRIRFALPEALCKSFIANKVRDFLCALPRILGAALCVLLRQGKDQYR